MPQIAPSVLSADFARLGQELEALDAAGCRIVHLDVMDGMFVPNLTFGPHILKAMKREVEIVYDVHLMISNPAAFVDGFIDAGADILTVHAEADGLLECLERIRGRGVQAGVSLKPATGVEALRPCLHRLDRVLLMTVEPGFGGQKFMADMMPKLAAIREMINRQNPACELEVDGGVNLETAKTCVRNGANVLVAGSAYFKAQDQIAFADAIHHTV